MARLLAGQLRTVPSADAVSNVVPSVAYCTAVIWDEFVIVASRAQVVVSNVSSLPSDPPTASRRPSGEYAAALAHDVRSVPSLTATFGLLGSVTSTTVVMPFLSPVT